MPIYSIDTKVQITENIVEIKTNTYELPDRLNYQGVDYVYDGSFGVYRSADDSIIKPMEYIRAELTRCEEANKKCGDTATSDDEYAI